MLKISLAVAVSMVAFGSSNAAAQSSDQQDENEPVAAGAEPASNGGVSASRSAILSTGSARSIAVAGAAVAPPGISAGAFVPWTTSYAGNDQDVQAQLQEIQELEQRMLQHPEYRDLLRARHRLSLSFSHPDLPELLQISKEQAGQLVDLLADQQVREQAERQPMWPGRGDAAAVQAFLERSLERQRAKEAELVALLGTSKFREWQEYEQSAMARFQVEQLKQILPAEAALRADQLRPLVQAIARVQRQVFEERARDLAPGMVSDEERHRRMQLSPLHPTSGMHQRIIDAAASILTPTQLEYFSSLLPKHDGQSQGVIFLGPASSSSPLPMNR